MGIGITGSQDNFFIRSIRTSIADIIHYCTGKEVYILLDNTNIITKASHCEITDIPSVNQNLAFRNLIKPGN